MAVMARPKKKAGASQAPAPKKPIASFKGSEDFAGWLESLSKFKRMPVSVLIEHALVHYAQSEGFDQKPPER